MRIVLTHPYCWPYVRRGNERFIAELGRYLVRRGHEVFTIATKPGRGTVEEVQPEGRRVLHGQVRLPGMSRLRLHPYHFQIFGVLKSLRKMKADWVHSCHYTDAFAANLAKRWCSHRTVMQVNWPPMPRYYARIPPDRLLLHKAVTQADRVNTISRFCRGLVNDNYGVDTTVIPVPVDLEIFSYEANEGATRSRPTLLSVASFDNPSKGLGVLIAAFQLLKRRVPEAVLKLSGNMPEQVKTRVIDPLPAGVRDDVHVLGVGKLGDLPKLYREASLMVLASMWEAYGMVVVESWACGTPVCVTRHGGLAEFLDDPTIATPFDPKTDAKATVTENAEGLAEAMLTGLALSEKPETAERCRARAKMYSWDRLGPEYEKLYLEPQAN